MKLLWLLLTIVLTFPFKLRPPSMYHIVFSRVIPDQEILKLRKRESQQLILQEHQNSKCDLVSSASLQRAHHLGVQHKHWHFFCIISTVYLELHCTLCNKRIWYHWPFTFLNQQSSVSCFCRHRLAIGREKRDHPKNLYTVTIYPKPSIFPLVGWNLSNKHF